MGQQRRMGGARFAVGFSYAGEDRALVAPLAEELARRCGRQRVLFDLFHEASMRPSWRGSISMCTCPGCTETRLS